MSDDLHYFYIRKNLDWNNKLKYGYVFGTKENLINRIYDSSSDHSELSQYTAIYGFQKSEKYESLSLYNEFDKLISLGTSELFDILENYFAFKFSSLREIQQYKVESKTKYTNEFIHNEGMQIIDNILKNEFPILGLNLVKIFTEIEIKEINQSCRQRENEKNILSKNILINVKDKINFEVNTSTIWNERNYQIDIIKYIVDALTTLYRIYLELATGGGKSYIIYQVIKYFQPKVIIIFSPRKNINSQNAQDKYMSILDNKYNVFNCSKQSNFEKFYKETIEKGKNIMIVACPQVANKKIFNLIQRFDLNNIFIWFDEAHHTIEKWVNRIDEREISFFMNDTERITKRVFTSASPDSNHIEKYPNIFGEHYLPITVKELISAGWLCPIKPYMYSSDNNSVNLCNYNLQNFKKNNSMYGFSFHNTRDNAYSLFKEHANNYINKKTDIKSFLLVGDDYVNSDLDIWFKKLGYNFRDIKLFEKSNNSIGYVVQQFSMGYDNNEIDFMVFSDPKMSKKDIIQCIGRGTRPDKLGRNGINLQKILNIMLPVFIKDELDHNFNRIEGVLRYLIYNIEIPFEEFEMNFNSTCGEEKSKIAKQYNGTEDMSSILLDLLRNGEYSELTEKKCIQILRNNNIHNTIDYIEFINKRPELNLPKNIFINYPKFYWEKTYINSKGENISPHYKREEITEKMAKLCHEKEVHIHDYEEPEQELHKLESKIPPEPLFRFYGGKSNDEYY